MSNETNKTKRLLTEEEKKMLKKAIKEAKSKRRAEIHDFKSSYNKNEILKELSRFELRGNIIDQGWFEHLKNDHGKVQPNAIFILSEIVYWYRPSLIFDEETGNIIGLKAKFKGDMLQKGYDQLAEKFGLTKNQVETACKFLEQKGLIILDFRTVTLGSGRKINNVLYIGINVDELRKISVLMNDSLEVIEEIKETIVDENDDEEINEIENETTSEMVEATGIGDPIEKKDDRLSKKKTIGYRKKSGQAIVKKDDTNTKNINTEIINTSINLSLNENDGLIDENKILFTSANELEIKIILNSCRLDEISSRYSDACKRAIESLYVDIITNNHIKIGDDLIPSTIARKELSKINHDIVIHGLNNYINACSDHKIGNNSKYLRSCLYNAISDPSTYQAI